MILLKKEFCRSTLTGISTNQKEMLKTIDKVEIALGVIENKWNMKNVYLNWIENMSIASFKDKIKASEVKNLLFQKYFLIIRKYWKFDK